MQEGPNCDPSCKSLLNDLQDCGYMAFWCSTNSQLHKVGPLEIPSTPIPFDLSNASSLLHTLPIRLQNTRIVITLTWNQQYKSYYTIDTQYSKNTDKYYSTYMCRKCELQLLSIIFSVLTADIHLWWWEIVQHPIWRCFDKLRKEYYHQLGPRSSLGDGRIVTITNQHCRRMHLRHMPCVASQWHDLGERNVGPVRCWYVLHFPMRIIMAKQRSLILHFKELLRAANISQFLGRNWNQDKSHLFFWDKSAFFDGCSLQWETTCITNFDKVR